LKNNQHIKEEEKKLNETTKGNLDAIDETIDYIILREKQKKRTIQIEPEHQKGYLETTERMIKILRKLKKQIRKEHEKEMQRIKRS
jgi:hypothetical protein